MSLTFKVPSWMGARQLYVWAARSCNLTQQGSSRRTSTVRMAVQLAEARGLEMVSLTFAVPSLKGPGGLSEMRDARPELSLLPAFSCTIDQVSRRVQNAAVGCNQTAHKSLR